MGRIDNNRREGLTYAKALLLAAEAIAVAILAAVAINCFGWSDGMRITVSYLIAYLVPRVILTRSRGYSVAAGFILLAVAALMVPFDILRLLQWTQLEEFNLAFPNIQGDGRIYYKGALAMYNSATINSKSLIQPGFSIIIVGLWKLFGVSVIWPQAMNLMFTLISVVLTGLTTRRLLTGRVAARPTSLVVMGMALCAMLFHYLVIGTSVLKEGTIYLAVSMAGYAMAAMAACDEERHALWRDIILLLAAAVLLTIVRASYLYFLILGVALMALPHWRRDWLMAIGTIAVLVLLLIAGKHLELFSVERHSEVIGGGWNMNRFYINSDSQQPYKSLLGYYFLYSPLHRLVMLPIPLAAQFLSPLPWTNPVGISYFTLISRFTWGWYVVGGISLFYFGAISWRRHENMGAWPWWPALVFAAIAHVMAGSVIRYVLPIQPLFVPVAVYVLGRLHEGRWRRQFRIWTIIYIILLIAALIISFKFKQGFFDPWLPEPPITE